MDYKKAYYSLIVRLKEAKEDNTLCDERYCCVIDGLIQEPEESERIRQNCIHFLELQKSHHAATFEIDECIAWLEKQGNKPKQTSIWKHWKDGIAGNGEGEPIYLVKYGNTYSLNSCLGCECDYIELSELDKLMLEKQGEQNPTDTYCKEHCKGYQETGKCYADGSCDAKIKAEQNHPWSEEDEKRMKNILSVLDVQVCWDGATLKKMNPYQKEIDWLQSLKQRMKGE